MLFPRHIMMNSVLTAYSLFGTANALRTVKRPTYFWYAPYRLRNNLSGIPFLRKRFHCGLLDNGTVLKMESTTKPLSKITPLSTQYNCLLLGLPKKWSNDTHSCLVIQILESNRQGNGKILGDFKPLSLSSIPREPA